MSMNLKPNIMFPRVLLWALMMGSLCWAIFSLVNLNGRLISLGSVGDHNATVGSFVLSIISLACSIFLPLIISIYRWLYSEPQKKSAIDAEDSSTQQPAFWKEARVEVLLALLLFLVVLLAFSLVNMLIFQWSIEDVTSQVTLSLDPSVGSKVSAPFVKDDIVHHLKNENVAYVFLPPTGHKHLNITFKVENEVETNTGSCIDETQIAVTPFIGSRELKKVQFSSDTPQDIDLGGGTDGKLKLQVSLDIPEAGCQVGLSVTSAKYSEGSWRPF